MPCLLTFFGVCIYASLFIYSKNVKCLHENYIHAKHPEINDGWRWAKRTFPLTLSHKDIQKYGYYSGIVSKVDTLVKKYPTHKNLIYWNHQVLPGDMK